MGQRKHFRAPRLTEFSYQGGYAYFIIICTSDKKPHFTDEEVVQKVVQYLQESAHTNGFDVYAYCFTSDHMHVLLAGKEISSLGTFVRSFKQKSGYYFKSVYGKALWQRSYYDHVLRKEESLNDVALYILNNPVRRAS